jgi:hypothetical protein
MDNKEIHPVRNFIDKKTKNTLKTWFHEKDKEPNSSLGIKNALLKIIKIISFFFVIVLLIQIFI